MLAVETAQFGQGVMVETTIPYAENGIPLGYIAIQA
jgi:hypothetical protein